MKLIIPVYFHTDETAIKRDTDTPFLLSECEIRDLILYSPPTIAKGIDDDGSEYGIVYTNGHTFESPLKVKELDGLIINQLIGIYN